MSDQNLPPSTGGNQSPPPGYQPSPSAGPLSAEQDKQYSFWAHLGGILGFLPALIVYLVFKDRSNPANPIQVKYEAKEALNWQITFTIAYVALLIVVSILGGILLLAGAWGIIGILNFLPFLLWVYNIVISVLAALKVNNGVGGYRYPTTFRFIK